MTWKNVNPTRKHLQQKKSELEIIEKKNAKSKQNC